MSLMGKKVDRGKSRVRQGIKKGGPYFQLSQFRDSKQVSELAAGVFISLSDKMLKSQLATANRFIASLRFKFEHPPR